LRFYSIDTTVPDYSTIGRQSNLIARQAVIKLWTEGHRNCFSNTGETRRLFANGGDRT